MTQIDKIIILIILICSVFTIILLNIQISILDSQDIIISYQGKEIERISLSEDKKTYEFTFGKNIGYIDVYNNEVRMIPMDKSICPRRICSKTGWISKKYQSIVCLPNKLTVEFSNIINQDIDYISF